MCKTRMERGFAENMKVDVCCADFLSACDACFEQLGIHERAIRRGWRIFFRNSAVGISVVCGGSARTKAAMQIANIRDFYVDAVH